MYICILLHCLHAIFEPRSIISRSIAHVHAKKFWTQPYVKIMERHCLFGAFFNTHYNHLVDSALKLYVARHCIEVFKFGWILLIGMTFKHYTKVCVLLTHLPSKNIQKLHKNSRVWYKDIFFFFFEVVTIFKETSQLSVNIRRKLVVYQTMGSRQTHHLYYAMSMGFVRFFLFPMHPQEGS